MDSVITLLARYGSLRVPLTLSRAALSSTASALSHLRAVLETAVPDAAGRVLTYHVLMPLPGSAGGVFEVAITDASDLLTLKCARGARSAPLEGGGVSLCGALTRARRAHTAPSTPLYPATRADPETSSSSATSRRRSTRAANPS